MTALATFVLITIQSEKANCASYFPVKSADTKPLTHSDNSTVIKTGQVINILVHP